jgi:hypothetical protein
MVIFGLGPFPALVPCGVPSASTTALMAPALLAVIPSNDNRSSSSRRSRTPQVNVPWAPPSCKAKLIARQLTGETGFVPKPEKLSCFAK